MHKESIEYPSFVGVCPVCNKSAEVVSSISNIDVSFTTVCRNEYYRHVKGSDGRHFLRKYEVSKKMRF